MACNACLTDAQCLREAAFRTRVQGVLAALACQYPSLMVRVDLWRPKVVSHDTRFTDDEIEQWIRLDEQVLCMKLEQIERFYQADVGIINQKNEFILLPEGYGLRPDDHVVIQNVGYLVAEATEQMGVCRLKVTREKSRFTVPGRFDTVYREMGIRARVL
jgi:hypothetical protein